MSGWPLERAGTSSSPPASSAPACVAATDARESLQGEAYRRHRTAQQMAALSGNHAGVLERRRATRRRDPKLHQTGSGRLRVAPPDPRGHYARSRGPAAVRSASGAPARALVAGADRLRIEVGQVLAPRPSLTFWTEESVGDMAFMPASGELNRPATRASCARRTSAASGRRRRRTASARGTASK